MIPKRVLEWRNAGVAMPSCKRRVESVAPPNVTEDFPLTGTDVTQFSLLGARCNFLASDRVRIQVACKELCRRVSAPTTSDWVNFKKMTVCVNYSQVPQQLTMRVDTDHTVCKWRRGSANRVMIMLADHFIKEWATTDTVVAISSGEVLHCGMTKGSL